MCDRQTKYLAKDCCWRKKCCQKIGKIYQNICQEKLNMNIYMTETDKEIKKQSEKNPLGFDRICAQGF